MVRNLWPIWIMFFHVFFSNIIKVNYFFYCFIILLHLISSFSLTKSLVVAYAYVSIESIDCILLSSFELRRILLISSVKILCLSHLNLCCVFKAKVRKMCIIKRKPKVENYENCLEATQLKNKIRYLEKNKINIDKLKTNHKKFFSKNIMPLIFKSLLCS